MKKKKIKVGILFGGRSAEHEVSLVSAASVMKNLDTKKYDVVPIGISKTGEWLVGPQAHKTLTSGTSIPKKLRASLVPEPQNNKLVVLNNKSGIKNKGLGIDVIFPVLHGTLGEDGTIQGLLELAGISYVGAGVLGSAVGMDKIVQKMIFQANALPTPAFVYFTAHLWAKNGPKMALECSKRLKLPLFVKPANLGSSVSISKAHNYKELIQAIKLDFKYDRRVIVEKSIEKPLEIECSVLGNDNPKASKLGQIISSNEFYDYNAKYVDGQSRAIIPAPLPKKLTTEIQTLAIAAFKALDLAGMARVDFLIESKTHKIYLNEVNTIPGFTSISMFPKLWEASGLSYSKLLDELIKLALERAKQKNNINTFYKPKTKWYR